jgi:hypothetical protein
MRVDIEKNAVNDYTVVKRDDFGNVVDVARNLTFWLSVEKKNEWKKEINEQN